MKKTLAIFLIVLFTLMIVGESQVGKTSHLQQGDMAGLLGRVIAFLLPFVGLYYSTKWLLKCSGHSHKLGRQTWATLLFWYSILAALIGLMMPVFERNLSGLILGGAMVAIWSLSAYACKRWQKRLRASEQPSMPLN